MFPRVRLDAGTASRQDGDESTREDLHRAPGLDFIMS